MAARADNYEPTAKVPKQDQALLKEIRDFREYAEDRWRKIREESRKDRRYIAGDPWDPADRKAREDAGRPCINHDELGQYVNQAVNSVRQNKRGIKVEPAGSGSNEQTAEFRQGLIRGIEHRSRAQQTYTSAFQQMVEGSYGFFRIGRKYVSQDVDGSDDQEIAITSILNPDSVLYDPDCKEPDWSDARRVLILDPWPRDVFKAHYPNAQLTDFSAEDGRIGMHWVQDRVIVVAEYWKVKTKRVWNKKKTRQVEQKTVCKYLTNGIEILDYEELVAEGSPMGEHIPVVPMIGPQRYLDEGGEAELQVLSLVRLAREPQLSLAFLVSQQLEEAGLSPKVPFMGYEGQFDTRTDWEHLHKVPKAYAEVKPTVPTPNGDVPAPLPTFQQFTPNIVAYEAGKESNRRAIQAAMGISPLPTSAQRQNEKSGIALQRIQQQQQIGTFHFNDIFDNALQYAGRIIDSWIPFIYDTEREIGLRQPDDSSKVVRINTAQPYQDGDAMAHYPVGEDEDHDITISTGPSNDSQREEAGEFLDTLVSNLQNIPPPGSPQAKLLGMAIRMKQLGPMGDQMADILDPQDGSAQQAAALQQGQQQMAMMQEQMQKLQAELQKAQLEKAGKVIDNQFRAAEGDKDREVKIAVAEITTKAQKDSERIGILEDLVHKIMDHGHAAVLQASAQQHQQDMANAQQQHEQGMADQNAGIQAAQSAQEAAQQSSQSEAAE